MADIENSVPADTDGNFQGKFNQMLASLSQVLLYSLNALSTLELTGS